MKSRVPVLNADELSREVTRHQTDRQEQDSGFCKENCDPCKFLDGLRVLQRDQVEVLYFVSVLVNFSREQNVPGMSRTLSLVDMSQSR